MAGKGDSQRPRQVSYDQYAANWEAVFGGRKPRAEVTLEQLAEGVERLLKDETIKPLKRVRRKK